MTSAGPVHDGESWFDKASETARFIIDKAGGPPQVALVLGSGLGAFAESLEDATVIPYGEVPHFIGVSVPGHAGNLVLATLHGVDIAVLSGRYHFYEGHELGEVVFPIRALRQAGARCLLLTNSSGGLNPDFAAGDLMLINDHINLTGSNPLMGRNDDRFGPRFPDMTWTYDRQIQDDLRRAAGDVGVDLREGVYVGLTGPTYETPAEVRMLRGLGGDAVGMSTVPEAIVAHHAGMRVGGVSCVANLAAGLASGALSHDEIKDSAAAVKDTFVKLVARTVELIGEGDYDLDPLPNSVPAAEG